MLNIVEMKFGSHLYGTSTPSSDLDYKAVHIPDKRQILLGTAKEVITRNTKDGSLTKNTATDVDQESYSLKKFLHLASQSQTVAMDMLFAPRDMWLHEPSYIWFNIIANKDRLISRKAASFVGYCRTQANRYGIKGSRMATAEAFVKFLEEGIEKLGHQAKLGENEAGLSIFAMMHEHAALVDIDQNTNGMLNMIRHVNVCDRKCPLTFTLKEAHKIYSNLFNEYGKRARAAKDNQGIDWKALSHAVRVGHECVELLNTGIITFPRPEAARLLEIKTGQVDYYNVAEEIERLLVECEEASVKSSLREEPDHEWINDFVANTHEDQVTGHI